MLSADEAAFLDAWAACSGGADNSAPVSPVGTTVSTNLRCQGTAWSDDEHQRFLDAMRLYPTGPWKAIATYIGTRTPRQARTHAQKHKEKLHRRQRKLQRMQSYLVVDRSELPPSATLTPHRQGIPWTPAEQDRLRDALQTYPQGPWRSIARHVGTRTIRQVMAYALKRRHELPIPTTHLNHADQSRNWIESLNASDLVSIDALLGECGGVQNGETDTDELLHRLLFVDDDGGSAVTESDNIVFEDSS